MSGWSRTTASHTTEHQSAPQRREFVTSHNQTVAGRPRSTSVSTANRYRTVTATTYPAGHFRYPDGATVTTHSPWVRGDDTDRQHTHPGGTAHTPGSGLVEGSTSTPTQRQLLNEARSTFSSTLGDWS